MPKEKKGGACILQQVPKGYVPVLLVGHKMERFLVHTKHLKHPALVLLLEITAYQEFGYQQKGILTIPCDAQHFKQVLLQLASNSS